MNIYNSHHANVLIYYRLPQTKYLSIDINLSNNAFSLPSEVNLLNHGYNLLILEFDFTQMDRPLKKVLEGVGFKLAI